MIQRPLLEVIEEVGNKIRLLERERNEAVARAKALDRVVSELIRLVNVAGAELEEILKTGANDDISQPQAVDLSAESRSLEQLGQLFPDSRRQQERRPPGASSSD